MIEQAISFVLSKVIEPALASNTLPAEFKNKAQNAKRLINHFRYSGDLYDYLQRFQNTRGAGGQQLVDAFHASGLETFEDIFQDFESLIGPHKDDRLRINDFVIGNTYNSYDLAIISRAYNIQKGGYLLGDFPDYEAVLCKYTLHGEGHYPNEWLVENKSLKVFAKSIRDVFSLDYQDNRAITESEGRPIYVFIKHNTDCVFNGIYHFVDYTIENDGSIWFQLDKNEASGNEIYTSQVEYEHDLQTRIDRSKKDSSADRKERINRSQKKARKITTVVTSFKRNADVIVEVLERANGICESCNEPAPFIRAKDDTPYLEVHHKVRLADDGDDTVENAIAVCPNCHRKMHFGKDKS